jgi:F-type H+-transporting ATPase subunit b
MRLGVDRAGVVTAVIATSFMASPAMASGALVLIPDAFMLPVLIVFFALLIYPLNKLLFQPIFHALDARAERIAGARVRSEQLQREADRVLGQYETAIREARAVSEVARQTRLEAAREEQVGLTTTARGEAERELETARGELHRSIDDARESLRASAEGLATAAAERVLGRALS